MPAKHKSVKYKNRKILRKCYSRVDYECLITAFQAGQNWKSIAMARGIPKKTAYGIIESYKKTKRKFPRNRGSHSSYFNSVRIMKFVTNTLMNPKSSSLTLEELRALIWKNRKMLLPENCSRPPSTSWIEKKLRFEVGWSKKKSSIEPYRRNYPPVLNERNRFVNWLEHLSTVDRKRLIWQDEHGVNFWTFLSRAWAPVGSRSSVQATSCQGHNLSVFQCVSIPFGKMYMMTSESSNSMVFNSFCEGVYDSWKSHPNIPAKLKEMGPIMLLDNSKIHKKLEGSKYTIEFKFLPKYSPFMNVAEFVNREHKSKIRQAHRKPLLSGVVEKLEKKSWGEKGLSKSIYLEKLVHSSWKSVGDNAKKYYQYMEDEYFERCKLNIPIMN
jgi:transposase